MIRFVRVVYAQLPEGQEWTIRRDDDDRAVIIVVNDSLDDRGRLAARQAARASLRKEQPALLPILLILAALDWLQRAGRHPLGAATMASVATAAAVSVITADAPPQLAEPLPQAVVTVTTEPTVFNTTTTASPDPSVERATPTERPTRRDRSIAEPARTWEPPPRTREPRTQAPRTRSAGPSPKRAPDEQEAAPEPTRRSATTTADAPTADATSDGPELISDGGGDPPAPQATPPPVADGPPGDDDPPGLDAQPTLAGDRDCGGIHVGVPLDPLVNVDVCLLD